MSNEDKLFLGDELRPSISEGNQLVERHRKRAIEATCRQIFEMLTAADISLEQFLDTVDVIEQEESTPTKLKRIRREQKTGVLEPVPSNTKEVPSALDSEENDGTTGTKTVESEPAKPTFKRQSKPLSLKTIGRTDEEASGKGEKGSEGKTE